MDVVALEARGSSTDVQEPDAWEVPADPAEEAAPDADDGSEDQRWRREPLVRR